MIEYRTVLSRADGQRTSIERTRAWPSVDDATEAARRWLRLQNNVANGTMAAYDTWTVSRKDLLVGWRIVAGDRIRADQSGK